MFVIVFFMILVEPVCGLKVVNLRKEMGRKGSNLKAFFEQSLKERKYKPYLKSIDESRNILQLQLPTISDENWKKHPEWWKILSDWQKSNGTILKSKEDFQAAKQNIYMSLKRSDYFEVISAELKRYRILSEEETATIKAERKMLKKRRCDSVSSFSSSYESQIDSPENINSVANVGVKERNPDLTAGKDLAEQPLNITAEWNSELAAAINLEEQQLKIAADGNSELVAAKDVEEQRLKSFKSIQDQVMFAYENGGSENLSGIAFEYHKGDAE